MNLTDLSVISPIQCHPVLPEMFEEIWQNLIFDVLRFNTIRGTALLHYLQTRQAKRILASY